MRNKIFFLLSFLLLFSVKISAQDNICESGYLAFRSGTYMELTNYNKKGKVVSISKQKVSDAEQTDGGFKTSMEIETVNDKGKSMTTGSYAVECRDGIIYMDMSGMLDPQTMAGFSNMEVEISGDALQFPNNLSVGQKLPDGAMELKAKTSGMTLFNMHMNISNRQVEASETVTTPAGTFECMKITQESEIKAIIRKSFKSATWYAKGAGMVKAENYDSQGNVESSTVLTKFQK